jgi:FkbM family methyltransferase
MLRQSLAQNGLTERTKIHELALGASDGGEAILCVPRGEPKNAHLLPAGTTSDWGPLHKTPVCRLDTLLADEPGLDFVKIDVEASDEDVLAGMEELIRKFRPAIVLEFNITRYKDPAAFLSNLASLYRKLDYIDYSGTPAPLDVDKVLGRYVNEDWLLFLSGA